MSFYHIFPLPSHALDANYHLHNSPVSGPLGRSGYAGRNWEGFAADPYLTGVAMEESILGVQDAGVQATAKHYIGNEQETQRNPTYNDDGVITFEAVSANIDDRTIHELYLWPFANAVRAGVSSVMCSYNRLNGSQACQNSKAQNGLLKGELGFQGYIQSDWGGTHSGIASVESGLDMDMPGGLGNYGMITDGHSYFGANLSIAVNNGTLNESRLDDMVLRILTPYFFLGQDKDFPSVDPSSADLNTFSPRSTWLREWNLTGERSRDVRANHGALIRKQAASSVVLLKNEGNALPLKAPKSIAIFGNSAGDDTQGFYNQVNFEYGSLSVGGGSGTGRLTYLVSPLEAIKKRAAKDNALVQQWLNNTLIATTDISTLSIPNTPDVCLVFLKTWAEEGADRASLDSDWDGNDVVESVTGFCNNTIVVTQSSGINVLPFADNANVTAILAAHYTGQEAGNSIVDVLYGDVNPSGKLPYTIALDSNDYNAPPTTAINTTGMEDWQSWFDEKLEIDYRYFDAHNISVRYEFGYGLSYTTFAIAGNVTVKAANAKTTVTALPEDLPVVPGGNPALWETLFEVTATVINNGSVAGEAVPQLYLTFPDSTPAGTPPKQLRGFDKFSVRPGHKRDVTFALQRRDISYWDIVSQQWRIPEGDFTVSVGFSSRDLQAAVTLNALSA